ncbi:MAG: UDP-3-O-(3-hydroxymyristoyl)glucosamine N-acyltransferase [Phycisphaerales bacterium]|nr:UDP-3-O-(3-hydroxymyristoyl)glucosamine N-acyltransferase [Planctomycetota bacterium]MBL6997330.1 UDP-3-O-(3-hydroxymyristoyl)glucosamine N-acyltransferase [Phycisphaerales bacterium]
MANEQHTAGSLADALHADLDGPADLLCIGVSSIEQAKSGDITFMVSAKYAKEWEHSGATIGIVPNGVDVPGHDPSARALLRVDSASIAMAEVLELFKSEEDLPPKGIHPSAIIDSSATVGSDVRIGPHVIVGAKVHIGDGVALCNHVSIGRGSQVGSNTILRPGVVIEYDCTIGEECILNANVTVGTDGFGYCPNADMTGLIKLQHVGTVVIGDRVEIGSNSCLDRGKFLATQIGNGTKIDNLVQIGHNVTIGENCVIASGTGIGGSVQVGNWVQIAAHVGIAPHCKVGDGAKIGAKSGLMHDIPDGEEWLGLPAGKMKDVLRQWASTRKLPGIISKYDRDKDQ